MPRAKPQQRHDQHRDPRSEDRVLVLPLCSLPYETRIRKPTTEMIPSSIFHVVKKYIQAGKQGFSKKKQETVSLYCHSKPHQPAAPSGWGFLTPLIKLWPSPVSLGPFPSPNYSRCDHFVSNTSLRKLSLISQLEQYKDIKPCSFPLQSFLPVC